MTANHRRNSPISTIEETSKGPMDETNELKGRRQLSFKRCSSLSDLRCESRQNAKTLLRVSSVRGLQKGAKAKSTKMYPTSIGPVKHAERQIRVIQERQPSGSIVAT